MNPGRVDGRRESLQQHGHLYADAHRLASSGFFAGGGGDLECFACGVRYPMAEHRQSVEPDALHPQCPFVLSDRSKLPPDGVVHYPEYATYASRKSAFESSADHLPSLLDSLARSGFFPLKGRASGVCCCYYCGGVMSEWRSHHNPREAHSKAFPACDHLQLTKDEVVLREVEDGPVAHAVNVCKMCLCDKMSCCLFPCGHVATCVSCSGGTSTCPVCSKKVESTRRVYYA